MYHIIDKRGTGKTGRLLLLAKDLNASIVCANPTLMREKAYHYGITGIDYIQYKDYLARPQDYGKVLIDNIEKCLPNMIGYTSIIEE